MEKKQKQEMILKILTAIKKKQEEKQIKQTELLDLCKEKGYNISQSELSRILSNKISLSLYSALALCDALDLDLNLLFHSGKIRNNGFHLSKEVFITDPEQSEIKNYLGVYHTLFHGTDSREEKLLRGRLELTSKKEGEYLQCIATFTLDTKDKDMLGKQILKKYQGQFFVSSKMGIAYCFLVNNKLGEICTIEFRHRTFFYKRLECRLGLVLTISTGEKRVPVVHKIAIFRESINDEQEQQIAHMLKLDNNEIRVSMEALENLTKMREHEEIFEKMSQVLPVNSYCIVNAAVLKTINRKLSNKEISLLFSTLRDISEEDYILYLDQLEDEMMFDIIQYGSKNGQKSKGEPRGEKS